MERTILFKAKPFDPSVGGFNFVFGHYVELHGMKEGKKTIGHYIIPENDISNMVEVIPETVCQLAKEHEGVKLFENDKLYVHFPEGWQGEDFSIEDGETRELIVSFNDGWFLTDSFDEDVFIFFGQLDCMPLELKIIGNIHD